MENYGQVIDTINEIATRGYKLNENYVAYMLSKKGISLSPRAIASIISTMRTLGLIMHKRETTVINRDLEKAIIEVFRSNGGCVKTVKLYDELLRLGFVREEIEFFLLKKYLNGEINVVGQDERIREIYKIAINKIPGVSIEERIPRECIIGFDKIKSDVEKIFGQSSDSILSVIEDIAARNSSHLLLERDVYNPQSITLFVKPIDDEDELLLMERL